MNPSCEHHKTCDDCFSLSHVLDLKNEVKRLANGMAEATEWNLATLEELAVLKSSSKARIDRQKRISLNMLISLKFLQRAKRIDWGTEWHRKYPRTQRLLEAAEAGTETLEMGLTKMVEACR